MATTYAEALAPFVADGSLTHYYPLNDVYTIEDVVGSIDAVNTGSVTFGEDGAVFNGSNYLSLTDDDDFSVTTTTDMTIVAVVEVTNWLSGGRTPSGSYVHWMAKGDGVGAFEWAFRHYFNPDNSSGQSRHGRFSFYQFPPGVPGETTYGAGSYFRTFENNEYPISSGQELWIAARADNDTVPDATYPGLTNIWRDGVDIDTDDLTYGGTVPTNGPDPVRIGRGGTGAGFIGKIRRLAFFNRKLTDTELQTLYAARNLPEGAWSGGGATPTFFSQVVDDFETAIDAVWTDNADGTWSSDNGGECHLATDTASGNHIATGYGYTLKDSAISFKMTGPVDTTGGGANTYTRARINKSGEASGTHIDIIVNPVSDTVQFRNLTAWSDRTPASGSASITYDDTEHVYFRLRESGGTLYFETSPDRATWTVQRTDNTPSWMDDEALQRLYFDILKDTGDATYAIIDEVNVFPLSALQDDFSTFDASRWQLVGGASIDSTLSVPASGTDQFANGAITKNTYNLLDGDEGFTFRMVTMPTGSARLSVDLADAYPTTANPPYTDAPASWFFDASAGPFVLPSYVNGGTRTEGTLADIADWYNIRRNGSNVEWRTAPDNAGGALTWTVVHTVAVSSLPSLTDLYVVFRGRGASTAFEIDDVGLAPSGDTAPSAPTSVAADADEESLTVTWAAPADDGGQAVTQYVVTWGTNQVTLDAATTQFVVSGLTGGVPATVCVKARNSVGFGAEACVTETPLIPPTVSTPSEPLNVSGTPGNKSVALTWDAPVSMAGTLDRYEVYLVDGTLVATSISESATVRQLVNGVPYSFQVAAVNENGRGALSPPTEPYVPFVDGDLADTAAFGAWTAQRATLESAIGQYLQPVAVEVAFGSTDLTEVAALAAAGRTPAIRLNMEGSYTGDVIANVHDDYFDALGDAIDALNVPVVVVPYYLANDWRMPWSPLYQVAAPGFDYARSCYSYTATNVALAFDRVIRRLRLRTSNVRSGWLMSVDPQQNEGGNLWTDYYPADPEIVDIIGLFGANYGVGPIQGKAGQTTWRTHADIFDAAYATATGLDATAPIWLVTSCHEPSDPWAVGGLPGFPPDAVVLADATKDKQTWITNLLAEDTYDRVQAVVWYDIDGVRKWSLESADTAILRAAIPGGGTWDQSSIAHPADSGAATILDKTDWLGAWGEDWANTYDRPDAKDGARVSVVYGVPGSAVSGTRTTAEMLKWNRLHGLLLRQLARYGMVGHAFQIGDLPTSSPHLLAKGTLSAGRVSFDASWDTTPGLITQEAGGMVEPDGGSEL